MKKKYKLKVMKLLPEWITVEANSPEEAGEIAMTNRNVVAVNKVLPCEKVEACQKKTLDTQ